MAQRLTFALYRLVLSPALVALGGAGYGCRFHPSCSHYAEDALKTHGFLKGMLLAGQRLLKCNPWNRSLRYFDPVPSKSVKFT